MNYNERPFGLFIEAFLTKLNQSGLSKIDLQEIQGAFSLAHEHSQQFKDLDIRQLLPEKIWEKIEPSFLEATADLAYSPRDISNLLLDMSNKEHTKVLFDLLKRQIEINSLRTDLD